MQDVSEGNEEGRCHKHEWEIEVVVATEGNGFILAILEDMSRAMAEKSNRKWFHICVHGSRPL